MPKPILDAENLSISYLDSVPVLSNISLALFQGKLLSIVGTSGSGKTTLLKLLAGLLSPDSGQITFQGQIMEGPDKRLVPGYEEIKLVHQQSDLRPHISAAENLHNALLGFKKSYREERLTYLLELFQLTGIKHQLPRTLSGGQQQRLTIACAMATEPAVLLMDEPFSALDPANTAILLQNIRKLATETNTAIVLVTHDSRYALMADEVMVISQGRIAQSGTPRDLYFAPATEEIAGLFGSVSRLTPAFAKSIGIKTKNQLLVRAEHVRLKKRGNGIDGKITHQTFMGMYHLVEIKLAGQGSLLAIDASKSWAVGDPVLVEIPPRRIICI